MKRFLIRLIMFGITFAVSSFAQGYPFGFTKVGQANGYFGNVRGDDPAGQYTDATMTATKGYNFWGNQIIPWSSGAQFDDASGNPCFAVIGGGHNDYHGNEVNVLCGLATSSPLWEPEDDTPGHSIGPVHPVPADNVIGVWEGLCSPPDQLSSFVSGASISNDYSHYSTVCPSGAQVTPSSKHTYDGVVYAPSTGLIYTFGGANASYGGGTGSDVWSFNPRSLHWTLLKTKCGSRGKLAYGNSVRIGVTAYNPTTGHILVQTNSTFAGNCQSGGIDLSDFDPVSGTWTALASQSIEVEDGSTAAVDPVNKLLITIMARGGCGYPCVNSNRHIYVNSLSSPSHNPADWFSGSGCNLIYHNGGIDWDSTLGLIVIYPGGGNQVELLNTGSTSKNTAWGTIAFHKCLDVTLSQKANPVKGMDYPQDPAGTISGTNFGIYGRFRYLPKVDAFILVNGKQAWMLSLQPTKHP